MKKPFDFGATLRELRKQKGYTQKRLAEALNLSETTISKYENNTAIPPFETVVAIAVWFNVSLDTLAGNIPSNCISLYGLSEQQTEIIKDLVNVYTQTRHPTRKETEIKYELIVRVVKSLQ